jgi:YidC/Oxa1 family membrane protein insertase
MEKRVVIAVILSIAVLYGYSYIFPPPVNKPVAVSSKTVPASVPVEVKAAAIVPSQVPVKMPEPGNLVAKEVVVETELFKAIFSTVGGGLKKLSLKKYRDAVGSAGREIVLVTEENPVNFSLLSESKEFGVTPSQIYAVDQPVLNLTGNSKGEIQFTTTSSTGLVIKKKYAFSADSYRIDLNHEVVNTSGVPVSGSLHIIETNRSEPHPGDSRYEVYGPSTLAGEKIHADTLADIEKGARKYDKDILWSSFCDKYFMTSVLAEKNSIVAVNIMKGTQNYIKRDITLPVVTIASGQSMTIGNRVFYGPKDLEILKAQGNRLEEIIDFGWFSVLAKPLLYTLKYFYSYTNNYGVAIIIITFILKLLFFPLTHKSYKSMKEMQKLQPKMNQLKEKFKNDRDAMNKAVMELYKTHKVNPLGGCLPMVIQIPVFFALYKALMFSIELRHAPFMLWILDLSAKDPYYVTPIIMGVTMFIQQKMTPTNMDPIQAKMMLALPVVFTFMFLSFPSGLVLYWLINNILTIAQQSYINKTLPA